jgi:hypothetical protein
MTRTWKLALLAWVLLYPVPPLPLAPALGYATAALLGPPYTVGTNADGWPEIGPVTPSFVAVTVGVPWLLTSLVVAAVGVVCSRRARWAGDAGPELRAVAGPHDPVIDPAGHR